MRARAQYAEYLAEVREQVCSHCPEHPEELAVCVSACRHCGVQLQLPRIVESIHDAGDALSERDPSPDPFLVCARCQCLAGENCPCPAGQDRVGIVQAVKNVDERREQWTILHRRVDRPMEKDHSAAELIEAYEAKTGSIIGCD